MWRCFSFHLVFRPRLWLTFEEQMEKFAVHSRSNFFSNFGHLFSPFNPVFYFHFKNINFFEIRPKLTFLRCFFHGTIFFVEEFLLSQKRVIKMWIDWEKNSDNIWYCESQCERNSSHIVSHIVVRRLWGEMNTFIVGLSRFCWRQNFALVIFLLLATKNLGRPKTHIFIDRKFFRFDLRKFLVAGRRISWVWSFGINWMSWNFGS